MSNYNNYRRKSYSRGKRRYSKRKRSRGFYLPSGTEVYILDILPYGHIDRSKSRTGKPIVQAIECPGFNLFEMSYDKDQEIEMQEKITVKNKPGTKLGKVLKRLNYHGLTQTSKELLSSTIQMHLEDQEDRYVKILNNAGPITKKRHSLSLLPGIGEKIMWKIIEERRKNNFESYQDFNERISVNNIKEIFSKRILNEIIDDEFKHYLFATRKRNKGQQKSRSRKSRSNYNRRSRRR